MRFTPVVILSIIAGSAASVPVAAPASTPAPFEGAWMSCEDYQGAEICDYTVLAQRGARVCGLQRYFATNATYEQRFVGRVKANVAHIEKICGDPGSETDTYCKGQAPEGAEKVGWGTSDRQLFLCNGRLHGASADGKASCEGQSPRAGVPRVRNLGDQGPEPGELAWLAACAAGAE